MRFGLLTVTLAFLVGAQAARAQPITAAGQPAQLDIRAAGERSIRVTLKPVELQGRLSRRRPRSPIARTPAPRSACATITRPVQRKIGSLNVEVRPNPLTVVVTNAAGRTGAGDRLRERRHPVVQARRASGARDGRRRSAAAAGPALARAGRAVRSPRPARHDGAALAERHVRLAQSRRDAARHGRVGTVRRDAVGAGRSARTPSAACSSRGSRPATRARRRPSATSSRTLGKGLPPVDAIVPGLYDVFVFDAHDPAQALKDFSTITGPAAMPPKWALGYMQSHRTLEDETQMLGIVDTFRSKQIPLDAVIYLGTGFTPRGWNTQAAVVRLQPRRLQARSEGGARRHARAEREGRRAHGAVGSGQAADAARHDSGRGPARRSTPSHIQSYWQQHVGARQRRHRRVLAGRGRLVQSLRAHQAPSALLPGAPVDAAERAAVEPAAQRLSRASRSGAAGSGRATPRSSWKTLEAQIAVGINYSLSIGPYWGSDIGGFYPNNELTGELYARWFQFAAFCGSFRSHGRTWWTRLPWGWGLERHGSAREQQHERADSARRSAQHPAVGDEQPGDRAGREEVRGAALSAHALHLHAGVGGARRPACR